MTGTSARGPREVSERSVGSPRRLDAERRTSWGEPRGVTIPSPNIWDSPEVYELENLGVDRAGLIEAAMREVHDWAGRDVLDIGCGTGFHLPRFAATARTVVGVEPHPPLVVRARRRVAAILSVRVVQARCTMLSSTNCGMRTTRRNNY